MIVKPRNMYYCKLREIVKKHGHGQTAETLALITGRSESYMSYCLAGRRSFQPKDMMKILDYFGIDKTEAMVYFPPFGIQVIEYLEDEQENVFIGKKRIYITRCH